MESYYPTVALVSSILGMYARYNFLKVFYEPEESGYQHDLLMFGLFYIVSNTSYLVFDVPILNLLIQIGFIFMICCFKGLTLKRALMATALIITMIVAIESFVVFFTGYAGKSMFVKAQYQSLLGIVAVNIVTLLISKLLQNYKNVRENIDVSFNYWMMIIGFPISSLWLLIIIFGFSGENQVAVMAAILIVLLMNLTIFWLYDHLVWTYERKLDDMVMTHLNMSYKKQLEIMRSTMVDMKSFQHDISRHFASMETLTEEGRYSELSTYLNEMKQAIHDESIVAKTGNIIIDSIINFEVNYARIDTSRIAFSAKDIPTSLDIRDYDLTVILSNLLSNALRAISCLDNGMVDIGCSFRKGLLCISVSNDYGEQLIVKNNRFITTQKDKENHGYGIENIKKIVKKYDGDLNMTYDASRFSTTVVLYEKA